LVDLATVVDVGAPVDTRGTREPSTRTLLRRAGKIEKQRLAIASANEAGYRRGRDEQDRFNTIRHDAEINILRNQMAGAVEAARAEMDREMVIGLLDEIHTLGAGGSAWTLSSATIGCITRVLNRGGVVSSLTRGNA
jgi:hypothetical protein